MKYSVVFFMTIVCLSALGAQGQNVFDKSYVILAHDHRWSETNFDDKNDFAEMRKGGITAKVIPIVTDVQDWSGGKVVRLTSSDSLQKYFNVLSWQALFTRRLTELGDLARSNKVLIIKRASDFKTAKESRTPGIVIATEGVKFLEGSCKKLPKYYKGGLRHIQLYREKLDSGAAVVETLGITEFGRNLIRSCNELGIALDVTHLERLSNYNHVLDQVISFSKDPVIVSHQHGKDFGGLLNDEGILAVAKSGQGRGVIAIHFISQYVKPAEISTLVKTILHIKKLVGIDHVALGGDYSPTSGYNWVIPDVTFVRAFAEELSENGFSDKEIEKVLGQNLVNFYQVVWKE